MKKRICLLLTLVVSIFIGVKSVGATYAVVECDFIPYGDSWIENKPLYLAGGCSYIGSGITVRYKDCKSTYIMVESLDDDSLAKGIVEPGSYATFNGKWYKTVDGLAKGEGETYSEEESYKLIKEQGICPKAITRYGATGILAFGGTSEATNKIQLTTQYLLVKTGKNKVRFLVIDKDGIWRYYDEDGNNAIKGHNNISTTADGNFHLGRGLYWDGFPYLAKNNYDYYKLSSYFDTSYNNKMGVSKNDEIIFDNGSNRNNLISKLDAWASKYTTYSKGLSKEPTTIVDECKTINEQFKKSNFNDNIASLSKDILNDLEVLFDYLYEMDNISYSMCITNETTIYPLTSAYNCVMNNYANEYGFKFDNIPDSFSILLKDDIRKYLEDKKLFVGLNEEQLTTLLTTIIYLDNNSSVLGLDIEYVSEMRRTFEEYAQNKNVSVILDCDSLISDELRDKIDSYMNIFRIAIPIILIGFGIFDFSKAFFSGNEDGMKKAQTAFFKRILVAILIFLIPIFINLLLDLANMVWGNFYSNCDLF